MFVPSEFFPSPEEEKQRYDLHVNQPDDIDYLQFLESFISPLLKRIPQNSQGLDFGSGPVPVLSMLLEQKGLSMKQFDPYYSKNETVLTKIYDFIVCVETVEHFFHPDQEWKKLMRIVKNKGWIGIKTEMFMPETEFSSWYYKGDKTHVCFYSPETFRWLADFYHLKLEIEENSLVFLQVI